jgi:hypothetical protein
MTTRTTFHTQDATWRSGVVRARLHSCSTVNVNGNGHGYLAKPAAMIAFPAIPTTRRGAPPQ